MVKKQDEIGLAEKGEETPPESEPEITPEEDVVTLSSKELQKKIDAGKADMGRVVKTTLEANTVLQQSLDNQLKRYSDLETSVTQLKQRDRDRELELAKDDPDLLSVYKVKHKAEDEKNEVLRQRSEFEREKALHEAEIQEAKMAKAEALAKELAETSGLAATLILQVGTDTADGRTTYNLERMKQIAKSIPKEQKEEEEEEEETRGQRSRASGAGSRTATRGLNTIEDYYKAYNEGKVTVEEMAEARKRFGAAF